jgi:DNA (cytosine-5)-methyltransferase 1
MARIQTFPHDLEFAGGRTSIQKQIGNAVPSLLAEVLARAIAEQFFGVGYENGPERAVKIQRPIPKPEKLRPVPVKFLDRVGEHPDHPGEGKGAASKKRLNATMQL